MKKYRVRIVTKPFNHPLNIEYSQDELLDKSEFLKLKRRIRKYMKNNYKISILSGQKEPLLLSEKLHDHINKIKLFFSIKKTITQMQEENTKREYIQNKYFWFFIIVSAIIGSTITVVVTKYF